MSKCYDPIIPYQSYSPHTFSQTCTKNILIVVSCNSEELETSSISIKGKIENC